MVLHKLTVKQIGTLKDGFHSDGGNLYLRVRGSARSWIFRYRVGKKVTDLGLGSASVVTLRAARERAESYRLQLHDGEQPCAQHREKRKQLAKMLEATKQHLLKDLYRDAVVYYVKLKQLRGAGALRDRISAIENHALSALGTKDLRNITTEDVANTLAPIWSTKPSIAKLVLASLKYCFLYGAMKGWVAKPFPTDWIGGLEAFLPKSKERREHHASVKWDDVPSVFVKMRSVSGKDVVRDLVLATVLCATRIGELRRMSAEDIDLTRGVVLIRNRKDGKDEPFVVPFPRQCRSLFERAKVRGGHPFLVKPTAPIAFLKYTVKLDTTVHGFRASFSTWCADHDKDPILRELCLCHTVESAVVQAYQRSDRLEPRRRLLQEWADYVTGTQAEP